MAEPNADVLRPRAEELVAWCEGELRAALDEDAAYVRNRSYGERERYEYVGKDIERLRAMIQVLRERDALAKVIVTYNSGHTPVHDYAVAALRDLHDKGE